MSGLLIGILGLILLLVLLFCGMHIGIAMSLVGFIGIFVLQYQKFSVLPSGAMAKAFSNAVGAFGAMIFMLFKRKFTFKNICGALKETLETTAMIFLIMIGSDLMGQFFSLTGMSTLLAQFFLSAGVSKWIVLLICLGIYGILGCFVDSLPLIVLLTPIFLPIVTAYDFFGMSPDQIKMWFGVLMVMLMELGLLTPPVGMCCYVMAGIAPDMSLGQIFKGTAPFLIGIGAAIIIVMFIPQLAVWLPSFMSY